MGILEGIDVSRWYHICRSRKSYDHSEEADTNPSDEATDVKHFDHYSSSLDDATDNEDAACHQYSPTSAKRICKRCQEGTDETSAGEKCHNGAGSGVYILLQEKCLEGVRGDNFCYHA